MRLFGPYARNMAMILENRLTALACKLRLKTNRIYVKRLKFNVFVPVFATFVMVIKPFSMVYPSSSLGWGYGANGNPGSRRQPN